MANTVKKATTRSTSKPTTTSRKTSTATSVKQPVSTPAPSQETRLEAMIRERAYLIWEHLGRPVGREMEHWLQAKKEILAQLKKTS